MDHNNFINFDLLKSTIAILDQLNVAIPDKYYDKPSDFIDETIYSKDSRTPEERLVALKNYFNQDDENNTLEISIDEFCKIPVRLISAYGF